MVLNLRQFQTYRKDLSTVQIFFSEPFESQLLTQCSLAYKYQCIQAKTFSNVTISRNLAFIQCYHPRVRSNSNLISSLKNVPYSEGSSSESCVSFSHLQSGRLLSHSLTFRTLTFLKITGQLFCRTLLICVCLIFPHGQVQVMEEVTL